MALIKQTPATPLSTPSTVIAQPEVPWDVVMAPIPDPNVVATEHTVIEVQAGTHEDVPGSLEDFSPTLYQDNAVAVRPAPTVNMATLAQNGFEGLAIDWTSFSSISLKTEGRFEDVDGRNYGTEFNCRLRGSKSRWVYRANPVNDNKRDVAFTYDKVTTQSGVPLQDIFVEWRALGKQIDEKEYLEVLVEMEAPGTSYDGEYRILSVSPTSKGRFSGHAAKAAAKGGGDPGALVTKVLVGPKVMKAQNPFWPWHFELVTS